MSVSVPSGAWTRNFHAKGKDLTQVLLFSGNYFSLTEHESGRGAFVSTKGGSWKRSGKKMTMTLEFDTADSTKVGSSLTVRLKQKGNMLHWQDSSGPALTWNAADGGNATPLTGPWLFAGRKGDNGQISRREPDQPRKTMKLLSNSRFQWIAYNTETKQFFGTGGGTYTAKDGKYIETIGFFSRDNKRVGQSLSFDFKVDGGEWHHSGQSSSGQPMYEIWAPRP